MSTWVSTESDITKTEDSTDIVPPPLKKPKTDPKAETGAVAEAEAKAGAVAEGVVSLKAKFRLLRKGEWGDPDYMEQMRSFTEQYERSEGYDVDWDKLDYGFRCLRFEHGEWLEEDRSKEELMELLIKTAIDEENEESGINLKFVEYVSANVEGVRGYLFYITFWAKDLSSPNPEPKLYQTKVIMFGEEIEVVDFRLKPT